jgi:hypothetical protein
MVGTIIFDYRSNGGMSMSNLMQRLKVGQELLDSTATVYDTALLPYDR